MRKVYLIILALVPLTGAFTPIIYWHGMGDNGVHVKDALSFIESELPGVYVRSVQIGSSITEDIKNSYFMDVNKQVEQVCETIRNDANFSDGYNAIGLSQGGQFLRAVAQRCPEPRMKNLITLGGQHQGVFGLPKCSAPKQEWCELLDKLLSHFAYEIWVQKFLVQAQYWHDPFKNKQYVESSAFIADINNERVINKTYIRNLNALDHFVMVKFSEESVVQPSASEWFGYFDVGNDKRIVKLRESYLYKEDRLGLKEMDQAGKLVFLESSGDHLQFSIHWFKENVMPFLRL